MRPEMAARPLHLFEAGVVTEQRFMGLQEAPATLGALLVDRLSPDKRVRIPFNPRERWLSAAREACRGLSDGVLASLSDGATSAVIGGECTVLAGALSGALTAEPELSLVYFDAHGDINNLDKSRVLRIALDRDHPEAPGLVAWSRRRSLWVHVDVDVIDPREFPAVAFAAVGGPPMKDFAFILRQVFAVADVRGISICGYDARADTERALAAPLADAVAAAIGRVPVRA